MDGPTLQAFLDDLRQQLALYREMIQLGQDQAGVLEGGAGFNPDDLLSLAGRKQNLMSEAATLDGRLGPRKDEWHAARDTLPAQTRDDAEALLNEVAAAIQTLIEMEDSAQRRIEAMMGTTQSQLDRIQRQSQVNRAYSAYAGKRTEARFVDRTTDE